MKYRIEVREYGDPSPYVYEFDTWQEALERLGKFDGVAEYYTITHYWPELGLDDRKVG